MSDELETIDALEPTLFGCPVRITLKVTDRETVDVTHALQWDGKSVTLDLDAVNKAIHEAHARGWGLSRNDASPPDDGPTREISSSTDEPIG